MDKETMEFIKFVFVIGAMSAFTWAAYDLLVNAIL